MQNQNNDQATGRSITLKLPYPPSVNRYWRNWRGRMVISKEGRTFRQRVWDLWFVEKNVLCRKGFGKASVRIEIVISPPDRRRRDLDNALKAILDGIQHAGIIEDDAQVKSISARWTEPEPPGFVLLWISDLEVNESGCPMS